MAQPNINTSAAIFGAPKDPMQTLFDRKGVEERRQREDQLRNEKLERERNDKFLKLLEFTPEEVYQPFNDYISKNATQNLREWTAKQFHDGKNPNDPGFYGEWKKRADQVSNTAKLTMGIKEMIQGTIDSIDESEYLTQDGKQEYKRRAFNIVYNPDGSIKDPREVDTKALESILDNPDGYDLNSLAKNFVDNLPKKLISDYSYFNNGSLQGFSETKYTGKLYKTRVDDQGDTVPVLDPETGNPLLNITPEVIAMAKKDPMIDKYVKSRVNETTSYSDVLEEWLGGLASLSREQKVTNVRSVPTTKTNIKEKLKKTGGLFNGNVSKFNTVKERYNTLNTGIIEENESALKQMIGNKTPQGIITDISIVGQDPYEPGIGRADIKNIVVTFKNQSGSLSKEEKIELPIRTEGQKQEAISILNSYFDKGSSRGMVTDEELQEYRSYLESQQPESKQQQPKRGMLDDL